MTISFKVINMIVAEYVVQCINNKSTIINAYSGDVLVDEFPAFIPIAFYIEIKALRDFIGPINTKLLLGKRVAMEGRASADLHIGNSTVLVVPTGMIKLDAPTAIKLYIGVEGEASVKAAEKKFILNPARSSPTASPQPPSQSPPVAPAS